VQATKTRTSANETIPTALAVPPNEAARMAGVGRTTLYAAMASGGLKSIKIGKRRLIAIDALRAWLLSHEVLL
jgi:excisionase family DNA binding protein